jgi:hypothetical protein
MTAHQIFVEAIIGDYRFCSNELRPRCHLEQSFRETRHQQHD